MDKSAESQFTSDFWREINEQYFMIPSPVTLNPISLYLQKFRKHSSFTNLLAIDRVVKNNARSRMAQLNYHNLKLRLSLLLSQRELQTDELQNLIDEMIDLICEQQLSEGLQLAQQCILNISKLTEEQQLQQYNQEEILLQKLQYQTDWPDELSKAIDEKQLALDELSKCNTIQLQTLEAHIEEINQTLMHTYSVEITGPYQMKLTKTHIQRHSEELSRLNQLIVSYEDLQIAEGIGKAVFNEKSNTITVIFEKNIYQTPVDLTLEHFANLQHLREVPYEMTNQLPGLRSDDVFEMQMCHYCRLMVDIKNLKQCMYNHFQMGLHEYNEELLISQRYKISSKGLRQYFQDLYSANYIIENQQIQCKRYFCLKCLKYEFDQYDVSAFSWICPLCQGQCTCIRCVRNDTIYKLKRAYLELHGDLEDIYSQSYFEILVNDKRKLIQGLSIEFINVLKPKQENEETLTPKSNTIHKRSINTKNIRKKRTPEIQQVQKIHKLTHIESSSSSIKLKKAKGIKRNLLNNYPSDQSQIFIQ